MQQKINKDDIRIVCKRWFQRSYGNTYHSVRVYHGAECIAHEPFNYGYGDQCKQTVFDIMRELGFYSDERGRYGTYNDYPKFVKEFRDKMLIEDVNLKREL